jgi:hypothetical protein
MPEAPPPWRDAGNGQRVRCVPADAAPACWPRKSAPVTRRSRRRRPAAARGDRPEGAFPDPARHPAARGGRGACSRRRVAAAAAGAHAGPGRRIRLRQDHRRQGHAATDPAHGRRVRLMAGDHHALDGGTAALARQDADGIPGPLRFAQPPAARRRDHRRGHARAGHGGWRCIEARRRAAGKGRPARRNGRTAIRTSSPAASASALPLPVRWR